MSQSSSHRSSSMSSLAYRRGRRKSSRPRRCWFGCIWLSRVYLMGSSASTSSAPEPEEGNSILEKITVMLNEKPLKMAHMLKVAKYMNESTSAEKTSLFECGVIHTLLDLITEIAVSDANTGSQHTSSRPSSSDGKRRARRNSSSSSLSNRGIGYGTGSTRSRWDIERTVEEKMIREEHLTWLLNVLNAYLVAWPVGQNLKNQKESMVHMTEESIQLIADSSVISLLEYNFRNDSFFDVSEHLEIYKSLLETTACMAAIPGLVPYLVKPYHPNAKSIAKELIPKFKENILSIQEKWGGTLEDSNFRMRDFAQKVTFFSEYVVEAAREYEKTLPPDQRIQTATHRRSSTIVSISNPQTSEDDLYRSKMLDLQLQTFRFIGDYGKLIVPYVFKKEARNINPWSPNLRDRTKRIAKELASISNALPLNASNSIYVCYDDSRCDILKILISGPDDTPYANGLFEFDVFFPTGYPLAPPKCAFLTTGSGNVRFNPNLYNDGKICLSILGTWEGRPEEKWNPYCSLMQVLVSIQGLIFVKEPYFNEPGFEKYQGTEKGDDYSRKYNLQIEHATLNYAIREQLKNPPKYFKDVIEKHFWLKREAILKQARTWLANVKSENADEKWSKKKEVVSFDTGYNGFHQERLIHSLIQELQAMGSPFAKEEKNKETLENESEKQEETAESSDKKDEE